MCSNPERPLKLKSIVLQHRGQIAGGWFQTCRDSSSSTFPAVRCICGHTAMDESKLVIFRCLLGCLFVCLFVCLFLCFSRTACSVLSLYGFSTAEQRVSGRNAMSLPVVVAFGNVEHRHQDHPRGHQPPPCMDIHGLPVHAPPTASATIPWVECLGTKPLSMQIYPHTTSVLTFYWPLG